MSEKVTPLDSELSANENPVTSESDNPTINEVITPATNENPVASEKVNSENNEQVKGNLSRSIDPEPMKKKNHGRRSLDQYNVSKITHILHDHLCPGDLCPECSSGNLYSIDPEVILTIKGNPLLKGEAFSAQGLRCATCQKIFRSTFPKEVLTQLKADFSAKAIVCLSKYRLGVPLYRLEAWQNIQCLPISDSELWEWTEEVALALEPIHQSLIKIAATAKVIHNDDTTSKVLELMAENIVIKEEEAKTPPKSKDKERVGIYTTAILAKNRKTWYKMR